MASTESSPGTITDTHAPDTQSSGLKPKYQRPRSSSLFVGGSNEHNFPSSLNQKLDPFTNGEEFDRTPRTSILPQTILTHKHKSHSIGSIQALDIIHDFPLADGRSCSINSHLHPPFNSNEEKFAIDSPATLQSPACPTPPTVKSITLPRSTSTVESLSKSVCDGVEEEVSVTPISTSFASSQVIGSMNSVIKTKSGLNSEIRNEENGGQQQRSSTGDVSIKSHRRFTRHFPALTEETVSAVYYCSMEKIAEGKQYWVGRMYLTDRHICYHGKLDRYVAKVNVRWQDVIGIQPVTSPSTDSNASNILVGIRVMSLLSKYTFTSFMDNSVPLTDILAQWHTSKTTKIRKSLDPVHKDTVDLTDTTPIESINPHPLKHAYTSIEPTPQPPAIVPIPNSEPTVVPAVRPKQSPSKLLNHGLVAPSSVVATATLLHGPTTTTALPTEKPTHSSTSVSGAPTAQYLTSRGGPVASNTISIATLSNTSGGDVSSFSSALLEPTNNLSNAKSHVFSTPPNTTLLPRSLTEVANASASGTFRGLFNRIGGKSKRLETPTNSPADISMMDIQNMSPVSIQIQNYEAPVSTQDTTLPRLLDEPDRQSIPSSPEHIPQKAYTPTSISATLPPLKYTPLPSFRVNTSAHQVWTAIYGSLSPVYKSAHIACETSNIEIIKPWPDMSEVPVVGHERTVKFKVAYYIPLKGKQTADSTEVQCVAYVGGGIGHLATEWIVESVVKTPNVPSGNSFSTRTRVAVYQHAPHQTVIDVGFEVEFHERVRFIEGKIEQGGMDGSTAFWNEIAVRLSELPRDPLDDTSSARGSPVLVKDRGYISPLSPGAVNMLKSSPSVVGTMDSGLNRPGLVPQLSATKYFTSLKGPQSGVGSRMFNWIISRPKSFPFHSRVWKKRLLITGVLLTLVNAVYVIWLAQQFHASFTLVVSAKRKSEFQITVDHERERMQQSAGYADPMTVLEQWSRTFDVKADAIKLELATLQKIAAQFAAQQTSRHIVQKTVI